MEETDNSNRRGDDYIFVEPPNTNGFFEDVYQPKTRRKRNRTNKN